MVVPGAEGGRGNSYCLMSIECQFYRMKRLLKDSGDGSTISSMQYHWMVQMVNFMFLIYYHTNVQNKIDDHGQKIFSNILLL